MTRLFMDIDHAANEVLKNLQASRGRKMFNNLKFYSAKKLIKCNTLSSNTVKLLNKKDILDF